MSETWLDVGSHDEVVRRKKFAVETAGGATIARSCASGSR